MKRQMMPDFAVHWDRGRGKISTSALPSLQVAGAPPCGLGDLVGLVLIDCDKRREFCNFVICWTIAPITPACNAVCCMPVCLCAVDRTCPCRYSPPTDINWCRLAGLLQNGLTLRAFEGSCVLRLGLLFPYCT